MNRILNQLNKVKNFSEASSKSRSHDIDPTAAKELIEIIFISEKQDLSNKSILVSNSESAILHIGLFLLNPGYVLTKLNKNEDEVALSNLRSFDMATDVLRSSIFPIIENSFDIAVLGPELDKENATSTLLVENAVKLARKVYFCIKNTHKKVIYDRFPQAECISEIKVQMPGSSKYHKQNSEPEEFGVFKIEK